MLQHTATQCDICNISQHKGASQTYIEWIRPSYVLAVCNTLQHVATHCNTSQHTATHRGFGDVDLDARRPCVCCLSATHCDILQHIVTYCNTLQHTSTHSNTLQHTSTCRGLGDVYLDGRRPCICWLFARCSVCTS